MSDAGLWNRNWLSILISHNTPRGISAKALMELVQAYPISADFLYSINFNYFQPT